MPFTAILPLPPSGEKSGNFNNEGESVKKLIIFSLVAIAGGVGYFYNAHRPKMEKASAWRDPSIATVSRDIVAPKLLLSGEVTPAFQFEV